MRHILIADGHEQSVVLLQGLGGNPPQDPIFSDAFAGASQVVQNIAGTAVQQAVMPARGAGNQRPLDRKSVV